MVLEIECVMDIGMNSILAEFHRELLNRYDLFFIDTSYGTAIPSYEKTGEHLKEYMDKNFYADSWMTSLLSRDFLGLRVDGVDIKGVSVASDEDGAILRRQVTQYMQERVGIEYAEQILKWREVVEEYQQKGREFRQEEEKAWESLGEWEHSAPDNVGEVYGVKNPATGIKSFLKAGILNLVTERNKLSKRYIKKEEYLSERVPNQGIGLQLGREYEDTLINTVLLGEYILEKTGRYGELLKGSALLYQTEYVLGGKEEDLENLRYVADNIFLIREGANTIHIISDDKKKALVEGLAAGLAALTTVPQSKPVFEVVIIAAWAGLESIRDVKILLEGGRVPLIKTEQQWFFGFQEKWNIKKIFEVKTAYKEGMKYEDYLRVLLLLQDRKTVSFRLMDVMEMDIRITEGNRYFRMDACIDSIQTQVKVKSRYGYDFFIERCYGY